VGHTRNQLTVKAINSLPQGTHGDGGGLYIRITGKANGQWIYRFRYNGRQRQMGLGGLHKVTLAKARQLRDKYQAMVVDGLDPIRQRKKESDLRLVGLETLATVADIAFVARQAELRDDGKAGRWFSPLTLHVLPALGKRPIIEISQTDIQHTLKPIWHAKADTARKAINRLQIVFKHAVAMGLDVDIQAVEKAKALLGKQRHQPTNIPSMPWSEVPAFYASLDQQTPVQLALRLLMLNPGPRSKPVRFLRLEHIEDDVWTVPADLMKGQKGKTSDWRTPLTDESLSIIEAAKPFERNGYLFPNRSGNGVISDASMSRLMERRGLNFRPHGFRSSFRTWAAETAQLRDIAELCLAHKIYGKVEAAYVRTDYLNERAALAQLWSEHITSECVEKLVIERPSSETRPRKKYEYLTEEEKLSSSIRRTRVKRKF